MDVAGWLRGLGLENYAKGFADHCIDAETLRELTADDLKELGVTALGHRKKLLAAIARLASEPPGADATVPPEVSGERREATVLFADLAGSTELSGALDPEELHALLNRYFETVDGLVTAFGGAVDKHIGDAVMAVFGAPVAHSNDSERAVRVAAAIHDAIGPLGDALGRPLAVHIGIACGEVVASGTGSEHHREYTVTGESVNLASRLESMAGPGETLVSDRVHRAVARFVDATAIGDVAVKGIDRPVPVWRVDAVRDAGRPSWRHPFIGRRAELRQFAGMLDACRSGRAGGTVLLRGEAGIGKTRLAEECTRLAEAGGFRAHRALVLDFGVGKGQDAVRALTRSLLETAHGGKKARAAAAERAAEAARLSDAERACLNDLLDLPQPANLRAVYDALDNQARNDGKREVVRGLIRTAAERQPTLILVEDVHWADRPTLHHLADMARVVSSCPAILLMTSRIDGDPLDTAWRSGLGDALLVTVDLAPLRRGEAVELAGALNIGGAAARRLVEACVERAGGNPLFLEQLLLSAGAIDGDRVPGSIRSLVLARMDKLEPKDRRALQAASALGQRFELESLRHLLDEPRYDCRGLLAHHLVRPEGDRYLFAHALIQESVYGSLLRPARQALHRRAADWFDGRDAVLRAEHLDRAADAAAPEAYLDAARAQLGAYRFERALELVERGLAIAVDPGDRFALTLTQGDLLHDLGAVDRCMASYRAAFDLARDDRDRCLAWIGLASGMRVSESLEEALALLDRAEPIAAAHDMLVDLMRLHHLRGNLCFPLGRLDGCREQHDRSLRIARRIGSAEGEARALGGLGDAAYAHGRMQTAHGHFERCVRICREHGLGRVEVANMSMIGHAKLYLLEFREAVESSRATIEAARRVGHARAELNAQMAALFAHYDLGEWDEARRRIDRALTLVERIGSRRFEGAALNALARILVGEGRRSEALDCVRRAVAANRETGVTFEGPRSLGNLAVITDDPDERRAALAEAERIIAGGCVGHNHLSFYRDAMTSALQVGEWDEVERFAAALDAYAAPEPLPWSRFFTAAGRALAERGRGRRGDDVARTLEALRAQAARAGMAAAARSLDALPG